MLNLFQHLIESNTYETLNQVQGDNKGFTTQPLVGEDFLLPPSRGRGTMRKKRPDSFGKENHDPSAKDQNQEDHDRTKPY
jgi:hypothetical protein